jgi:hypothetical protein
VDPFKEGNIGKTTCRLGLSRNDLVTARKIAKELGEALALYFIDIAILEARRTNPPDRDQ